MKELSIEQKAKRYDEAIKVAKDSFTYPDYPGFIRADVVFPELKESEDEKWIPKEIAKYLKEKGDFRSCWLAWLEKQCEQKSMDPDILIQQRVDALADIVAEQTPVNKVEPRFHEGQWIVQENIGTYKVIEVCESWYEIVDNKGKHYSIGFDKEDMCHLWTIEDAKDGDVLAYDDGSLAIFHHRLSGLDAGLYLSHILLTNKIEIKQTCVVNNAYPATKEQRVTLEKAMAAAGWEFDFKKIIEED